MHTTKHGERRARKRCGISKKNVDKMRDLAYEYGLTREDVSRRLCRYMDAIRQNRKGTKVRLYKNFVWIFGKTALITVYPIPHEYQKAACTLLRRKCDVKTNS